MEEHWDHIRVDGKLLRGPERHTYIVLNKPKGYVTTVSDPEKRPTVMDLIGGAKGRVYPVGRLDWDSEGLLIVTNDGALTQRLAFCCFRTIPMWLRILLESRSVT